MVGKTIKFDREWFKRSAKNLQTSKYTKIVKKEYRNNLFRRSHKYDTVVQKSAKNMFILIDLNT